MQDNYLKTFYDDFVESCNEKPIPFNIMEDNVTEVMKYMEENADTPLVVVCYNYHYMIEESTAGYNVIDENGSFNQIEFDYEKTMPIEIGLGLTILSKSPESMPALEKYLLDKYSTPRQLSFKHPFENSKSIPFSVQIDKTQKINRESRNSEGFTCQSIIPLICNNGVDFARDFHPAQIAFDSDLQIYVLKRMVAFNSLSDYFEKKLPYQMTELKDESYAPTDTDVENQKKALQFRKLADDLRISSEILPEKCNEPFYIEKFFDIFRSSRDNLQNAVTAFEKQYDSLTEEKKKLESEKKAAAKEAKKADESLRRKEMRYRSRGDKILNLYTDAVVQDIKEKLSDEADIAVYGGSTYMDFIRMEDEKAIKSPCVFVKEQMQFTFERNTYTVETMEGQLKTFYCNFDALPINYNIVIVICADTADQNTRITEKLMQKFSQVSEIKIALPAFPEYRCVLKLSIDQNVKTEMNSSKTENYFKLCQCPIVYTPVTYEKSEIENNPQLQFRLLQQAEYSLLFAAKLQKDALRDMDVYFKHMAGGGKKLFSGMLSIGNSKFKTLKRQYELGLPLDKTIFKECFKRVIEVYPMLYERTMKQWKYEQLVEDIQKSADQYANRWNNLCNLLEIPTAFSHDIRRYIATSPREASALVYHINQLSKSSSLSLKESVEQYDELMWQREQQARREDEERMAAEAVDSGGSSGHGILSSVAGAAFGAALGSKKAGGGSRGNEKPDLIGSARCMHQYGACDPRCPLRYECRRG